MEPRAPAPASRALAIAWLGSALALLLAAGLAPGAELKGFGGAVAVAAIVGVLNAVLPPLVAALRLPFTVAIGFLLALALDAAILILAAEIVPDLLRVDGLADALLVALIASAISTPIGFVAASTMTRVHAPVAAGSCEPNQPGGTTSGVMQGDRGLG